ncbi:MAG TPA: BlaI/MecI/CopY family transcriptional regulator [Bacteroidales bacterium]
MKEITKAQEEILKALWKISEGAVSDILEALHGTKPAYNTVATVIKVLEKKKYVSHKTFGKTNVYYPMVTEHEYAKFILKDTAKGFFNGSLNQMVSFFMKNKDLSLNELEELKDMIEQEINKNKAK